MKDWEYHPLAMELTPPMAPDQFEKLKESIRLRGVRKPAMQFEGMLLDGRHRHRALKELRDAGIVKAENGVELDLIVRDEPSGWTRKDAALFVADENLHRRQMTKEQLQAKAVALVKILEGPAAKDRQREAGGDKKSDAAKANAAFAEDAEDRSASLDAKRSGKAAAQAAKVTGLSQATVERAVAVDKKGTDEVKAAVESGAVSVSKAAKIVAKSTTPEEQNAKLAEATGAEVPEPEPPADPTAAPPAHLVDVFKSATTARGLIQKLSEWEGKFDDAVNLPGFAIVASQSRALKKLLEKVRVALREDTPGGVCPKCGGSGCETCGSSGWVTVLAWSGFPAETKAPFYGVK